jgi:SNF2 family DNA or RNA helicase
MVASFPIIIFQGSKMLSLTITLELTENEFVIHSDYHSLIVETMRMIGGFPYNPQDRTRRLSITSKSINKINKLISSLVEIEKDDPGLQFIFEGLEMLDVASDIIEEQELEEEEKRKRKSVTRKKTIKRIPQIDIQETQFTRDQGIKSIIKKDLLKSVGRNQPCPCGSGRKYKRCCLNKENDNVIPIRTQSQETLSIKKLASLNEEQLAKHFNISKKQVSTFLEQFAPHMRCFLYTQKDHYYLEVYFPTIYPVDSNNFPKDIIYHIKIDPNGRFANATEGLKDDIESTLILYSLLKGEHSSEEHFTILHRILTSLYGIASSHPKLTFSSLLIITNREKEEAVQFCDEKFFDSLKNLKPDPRKVETIHKEMSLHDRLSGTLILDNPDLSKLISGEFSESKHRELHELVEYEYHKRNKMTDLEDEETPSSRTVYSYTDSLQYLFSDGTTLRFSEISTHPLCALIPKNLLPSSKSLSFVRKSNPLCKNWPYDPFYHISKNEELKLKSLMSSIVHSALEKGQEVHLVIEEGSNSNQKMIPLKGFKELPNDQYQWNFSYDPKKEQHYLEGFIKSIEDTPEQIDLLDNYIYNHKDQLLIAHTFDDQIMSLNDFQIGDIELEIRGNKYLQYYTHDDEILEDINILKKKFGINIQGPTSLSIPIDDTRIRLELHDTDNPFAQIDFSFKHEGNDYSFFDFNNTLHNHLFLCLKRGLGGYFEEGSSYLAHHTNQLKRKYDLMFLKHNGIYAFILSEVMRVKELMYSSEETNQINPKKAINQIIEDTGILFNTIVRKDKSLWSRRKEMSKGEKEQYTLKSFCSTKMQTLLKRFLTEVLGATHYKKSFIIKGKFFNVELDHIYTYLIKYLLNIIYDQYGHELILRASFPKVVIDLYLPTHLKSNKSLIKDGPWSMLKDGIQSFMMAYDSHKMDLFINGNQVEELNENDFDTKFIFNGDKGQEEQKIDWFELEPQVFFKGKEVSKSDLEKLSSQKRYIELDGKHYIVASKEIPKIKWLNYFWDKLQDGGDGSSKKDKKKSGIYERPHSQILNMLALRKAGIPVIGGEGWKKVCQQFDTLTSKKEVKGQFPFKLKLQLKHYQEEGVQWLMDLYSLQLGGILADDMGLGKTAQMIALMEWLRVKKELGKVLIVVPSSLVYNWSSEIEKFAPKLPYLSFDKSSKEGLLETLESNKVDQIIICTYGLLTEHIDFFEKFSWNLTIFDEAQNIKNIKAKRTTAARKLKAKSCFCITGTPMENHYGEFYSLMDLVVAGSLGSYQDFMAKFGKKSSSSPVDSRDIEFLKLKTAPLVLRRTKDAILNELPEKSESVIPLTFEKKQGKIYRDIAISWNDKVKSSIDQKGEGKSQLEMLTALLRLRQVCSCPSILPEMKYNVLSPKFDLLLESAEELTQKGESILIFTNFKSTLEIIKKHLKKRDIICLSIDGSVSSKKRIEVLNDFNSTPQPIVLLMTMKTGGVGLNLTKASYVFHVEPWWNPAAENQATDRAYRLGQTNKVQVYRYIMKHSVEEKIQELKSRKRDAFDALFTEKSTVEEVNDLTSLMPKKSAKSYAHQRISKEDFEYLLS